MGSLGSPRLLWELLQYCSIVPVKYKLGLRALTLVLLCVCDYLVGRCRNMLNYLLYCTSKVIFGSGKLLRKEKILRKLIFSCHIL